MKYIFDKIYSIFVEILATEGRAESMSLTPSNEGFI